MYPRVVLFFWLVGLWVRDVPRYSFFFFSVLIGMVFAYGLQVAKNFQLFDDSSDKTLTLLPCGGWKVIPAG